MDPTLSISAGSGDSMPTVRAQSLPAPVTSAPGSVFRRFCHRDAVLGNLCLGLGFLLPPLAIAYGSILAGILGATAGAAAGCTAFWGLMNRMSVLGNGRLRERLAERLGSADPDLEFVGLCLPENNTVQGKLMTVRLETDDNVGFLLLGETHLSLLLEEGTLRIAREQIREVTMERYVELPFLRWIALEYYEGEALRKILLCSRQCRTLMQGRAASERLMRRIVDWYTEPVVQQLEASRWT